MGDHLPPERTPVEGTGLSRGPLREALRVLEADGLVEILRGRSDGIHIASPWLDWLSRSVEIFVRVNAVSLRALVDCRFAVEPMMAQSIASPMRLKHWRPYILHSRNRSTICPPTDASIITGIARLPIAAAASP